MDAQVTISGRLTADPELKFLSNGTAVATFTVAHSRRKFDKQTNTWVDDGDTLFLNVDAWKQLGEGAAENLRKGDSVIVTGDLRQENWERDGKKNSRVKLTASDIGASVRSRRPAAAAQPEQVSAW